MRNKKMARYYELEKLAKKLKERNGNLYNFRISGGGLRDTKLEGQYFSVSYDAEFKTYSLYVDFKNRHVDFEFTKQGALIDFIESNIPDDMETNMRVYSLFNLLAQK